MFAEVAAARLMRPVPKLTPAAVELLEGKPWVGNVRELKNVVERAVILSGVSGGLELRPEHFGDNSMMGSGFPDGEPEEEVTARFSILRPNDGGEPAIVPVPVVAPPVAAAPVPSSPRGLENEIRELERRRIAAALDACGGNQSQAARELGISRAVLMNRMKVFGLGRPKKGTTGNPPPGSDDDVSG
jgi:DNA-binding NtrC family response regulator